MAAILVPQSSKVSLYTRLPIWLKCGSPAEAQDASSTPWLLALHEDTVAAGGGFVLIKEASQWVPYQSMSPLHHAVAPHELQKGKPYPASSPCPTLLTPAPDAVLLDPVNDSHRISVPSPCNSGPPCKPPHLPTPSHISPHLSAPDGHVGQHVQEAARQHGSHVGGDVLHATNLQSMLSFRLKVQNRVLVG